MLMENKNILKNNLKNIELRMFIISVPVALYLSIVAYLTIWDTLQYIAFFPILFLGFYSLCLKLCKTRTLHFPYTDENTISNSAFFMVSFLIILAGQLLYWLAFYPGGFNLDAYGQWDQVHGLIELNNWHPVFTTACYWLITRIADSFPFCIFVQLLIFSLSVSYLLLELYRLNVPRILLWFSAVYIAVNPAIGMNNVCLFKDGPFTIAMIWMTLIIIKVISTNGQWLHSVLHAACMIADMIIISLIRHNGIFVIIPEIICMAFVYRHCIKRIFVVFLSYLLIFSLIEGPIFSAFSIEQHSNVVGESVGIPMAIMANNFVSDKENTPKDVEKFLLSIADEDEWEDKYILGEWDSCKWDFGGTELFQGEPLSKFVELAWQSLCASPASAYQSLRENTRVVWQVLGSVEWVTWVYIEDNDYGIQPNPNRFCLSIADALVHISTSLLGVFLCWNIGVPTVFLVLICLFVVSQKEYQKLLLVVPFISYNLLTMLLLCGPSHRYFYFNSVLVFPIIFFTINEKATAGKIGNIKNMQQRLCNKKQELGTL